MPGLVRMADIVEAWLWRDPAQIIDRLLERSARQAARDRGLMLGHAMPAARHDRYYTQARHIEIQAAVKRATEGKR